MITGIKSIIDKMKKLFKKEDNVCKKDVIEQDIEDKKQTMKNIFTSIIDGIKIAMASLLSIFVPQYCEESGTTCTLKENFTNLNQYNEFVIVFNFITLGIFFMLNYYINKREAYIVSHLDESRDEAYNSLVKNMKLYPRILKRIREHNILVLKWIRITILVFIMNVILSSMLIYYYFYDGFRSITVMISNVLLISSKLNLLYETMNQCTKPRTLALSCINQDMKSYNIIDYAYSIDKGRNKMKKLKIMRKKIKKVKERRGGIIDRMLKRKMSIMIRK